MVEFCGSKKEGRIFLDIFCKGRERGEEINFVVREWVGMGKFF